MSFDIDDKARADYYDFKNRLTTGAIFFIKDVAGMPIGAISVKDKVKDDYLMYVYIHDPYRFLDVSLENARIEDYREDFKLVLSNNNTSIIIPLDYLTINLKK